MKPYCLVSRVTYFKEDRDGNAMIKSGVYFFNNDVGGLVAGWTVVFIKTTCLWSNARRRIGFWTFTLTRLFSIETANRSRARGAGDWITSPRMSNTDAWQGQANCPFSGSQGTVQPR